MSEGLFRLVLVIQQVAHSRNAPTNLEQKSVNSRCLANFKAKITPKEDLLKMVDSTASLGHKEEKGRLGQ